MQPDDPQLTRSKRTLCLTNTTGTLSSQAGNDYLSPLVQRTAMTTNTRAILVTGSHRSGSTWIGKMICASPNVAYIHEPFKPTAHHGVNPKPFPHWYYYLCPENDAGYKAIFQDILQFRYHLGSALAHDHGLKDYVKSGTRWGSTLVHRLRHHRPLLKDPIALLSSEWLAQTFPLDVLIIIRHPAAFVSSLKVKDWSWDFSHFLNQPLLMRDHLGPFQEEMEEFNHPQHDLIDRAAVLWKCLYHVVDRFRQKHSDWIFVRHEDVSRDPLESFQPIFQQLGLDYSDQVRNVIADFSGSHNPTEKGQARNIRRDSRANIQNWKKRLTPDEINRVRNLTNGVAQKFYAESDW